MAWLTFETGKMMTILFVFEWADEEKERAAEEEEGGGMRINGVRIGVASDHKMVMADSISNFFWSILFLISMGYTNLYMCSPSSSSTSRCCHYYYYYYHIVSPSMKFALSFDVFLWKECFQQWYILSWLASTQYLVSTGTYLVCHYFKTFE